MAITVRVEVRTDPRALSPLDPPAPKYLSTGTYVVQQPGWGADVANGIPAAVHVPLTPDAVVAEITVLAMSGYSPGGASPGGRVYAAFGSPADPTAEPRFLIDGKRVLHVPGGTELALAAAS